MCLSEQDRKRCEKKYIKSNKSLTLSNQNFSLQKIIYCFRRETTKVSNFVQVKYLFFTNIPKYTTK